MRRFFILCIFLVVISNGELFAQKSKLQFYELKVYRLKDKSQESGIDAFLKDAYLPAMHKAGIKNIGVFKPVETDTINKNRIYVLTPYSTLDQMTKVTDGLIADADFNKNGKEYLDAIYTNPPYDRIELTLLRAFPGMPIMEAPAFSNSRSERIYELRSYEGHTEKIYRNKVKMFNDGDEVGLFKRLGFNAVFYADVIAGSRMPNLMYMTSFSTLAAHDEKWKSFREDSQWKKLSTMEEYQHNVSKNTQYLLRPTEYSDY
jgi:NIPSNAP